MLSIGAGVYMATELLLLKLLLAVFFGLSFLVLV